MNCRRNKSHQSVRCYRRIKGVILLCMTFLIAVAGIMSVVETTKIKKMINSQQEAYTQGDKNNQVEQVSGEGTIAADNEVVTSPPQNDRTEEVPDSLEIQQDQENLKKAYLTFDDGPSNNTDRILDILKQYNVKATFFVIGHTGEQNEAKYRRIVEEGHTIGLHTYSHRYKDVYDSLEKFESDLLQIRNYVRDLTGVDSSLVRFPGGSSNHVSSLPIQVFIKYLNDSHYKYYDWNVDSGDAKGKDNSVEVLLSNIFNEKINQYHNIMILMHDSDERNTTVDALPQIIEGLQARNFIILPITSDTEPIQHVKAESVQ